MDAGIQRGAPTRLIGRHDARRIPSTSSRRFYSCGVCLSLEWFRSRAEAKVLIEIWRKHYNEVRPHSSLGYLTPNEFKAGQSTTPPMAVLQ
jgi:transposase InsO family protein